MQVSELANRYARAVFELASQSGKQDRVLEELRALQTLFEKEKVIHEFLASPLNRPEEREKALATALKSSGVSEETLAFVLLLAQKGRIALFSQIVEAVKSQSDLAHGVTRGMVRSASVLTPDDRKRIEDIVSRFTKKQVILTYKEDSSVIGGLIAEVGTFSFDDTLTSHLRRLKDEMMRRVQ